MNEEKHILEKDKNGVRFISLNRPERKNALNWMTIVQLNEALERANGEEKVRCVVLTGEGGAFCSGLDLKTPPGTDGGPSDPSDRLRSGFHKIIRSISKSDKIYIAMIPGPAAGFGLDIALACDLRYAGEKAIFAENFVQRALIPDGGGTYHLPRIVGLGKALEMALLGERLSSEEAKKLKLVNDVFRDEELESRVFEIAEKIAKGPPLALRLIKRAIRDAFESSFNDALEREINFQLKCISSEDFVEGVVSFLEKRAPVFKGR